jgi:transcriptional regulator GlxA family with amidase domain
MTRRISMIAIPQAQFLDIVGPLEVFSRAARLLSDDGRLPGPPAYAVEVLAHRAGPVVMSSALEIVAARGFAAVRGGIDTLLVCGGRGVDAALSDGVTVPFIQRMAPRVRRIASVCTGAFLLAEAGVLDGKRATTHWRSAGKLAERYPKVSVDPDPIFIAQGDVLTSAGVTAGMDLALALVEADHGPDVARNTARELVMFVQRPGGQSQFSVQLEHLLADRAPVAELQAWLPDHLDEDLTVEALARRTGMSPRNFARVFTEQVGATPRRYIERLRLEASQKRLEQTRDGVDRIADSCGFGTAESMRRVYVRNLRIAPSAYRARFAQRRPRR